MRGAVRLVVLATAVLHLSEVEVYADQLFLEPGNQSMMCTTVEISEDHSADLMVVFKARVFIVHDIRQSPAGY